MTGKPLVSVVMPVYNAAGYLGDAIDSVLRQSWRDFELIILDDGSVDESASIARQAHDPRIRLVSREHLGISATRNELLSLAVGQYLALMDADDLCHPDRLAVQVAYLDRHPSVGMVGTWARCVDGHGKPVPPYLIRPPITDTRIRMALRSENPFTNGSAMVRAALAREVAYCGVLDPIEDYDFWLRFSEENYLANVPRTLYTHRRHQESASHRSGIPSNQTNVALAQRFALQRLLTGEDELGRPILAEREPSPQRRRDPRHETVADAAAKTLWTWTAGALLAGEYRTTGRLAGAAVRRTTTIRRVGVAGAVISETAPEAVGQALGWAGIQIRGRAPRGRRLRSALAGRMRSRSAEGRRP